MTPPGVTVICLCHNHERFVQESLDSVFAQNYDNLQVIVVDDASSDRSVEIIESHLKDKQAVFIPLKNNHGHCKAFNKALEKATGNYIIDLATDDILLADRIRSGVQALEGNDEFGVDFCNVVYINEAGKHLKYHYKIDENGTTVEHVPQGDLYLKLVGEYLISSPSMLIRKKVLDEMGGYDESLAYEDFDLWVRSSRNWKYHYTNKVLVRKRIVQNSQFHRQYKFGSKQMRSTYEVCKKIAKMNREKNEEQALQKRIAYEARQSLRTFNLKLACQYFNLYFNS